MRISFRNKLLAVVLVVLAVTLASTMLAVLRATNTTVEERVQQELALVQRVFLTLLEAEREQLRNRGELLAGDFAFKRAIAAGGEETLVTVLANHGERIDADLVLLLSNEYEVLLTTHRTDSLTGTLRGALDSPAGDSVELTVLVENAPYQLVLVPVLAPDLIGWVGLGVALDSALLVRLRDITSADITLVFGGSGAAARRSTLPAADLPDLPADVGVRSAVSATVSHLRNSEWLSRDVSLIEDERGELHAILSASLREALAGYQPLRLQMVLIAISALVLAAFTALLVSRWVTRPIYRLMGAAAQIADGNYTRRVELQADIEFERLADTLNLMQDTVAEREARIRHQAQHDMLTQLPNRNYIYSLFYDHIRNNPAGARFGLGLLELSNLTQLTDLYGGEFSDAVLKAVATQISDRLRRGDMAARVADNHILMFYDDMDHNGVAKVVRKLEADFIEPLTIRGVPVRVRLLIGFVLCPQHGQEFDDVLRRAQIALAHARSSGEAFAVYQIGQDESHLRQISVANRLQVAVRDREFTVQYQPKYNLHSRRVEQVEALMRWTDPELGQVFPDEFIPLAEQTGIITRISEIVVDKVLSQLLAWREAGLELTVCINLSGVDILKGEFVQATIARLHESGLPPSAVVMEITETAMVTDIDVAMENITQFRDAGIGLSIDDFGTGFSSLAQLKALPVQELKIDKSLVQQLDTDTDDQLIVRSTIEMAHYLGLKVVAEGVENIATLGLLQAMDCDAIQGYFLARPMAAEALSQWLARPPAHVAEIPGVLDETA